MYTTRWNRPWFHYLWITAAYAAIYALLRLSLISHWQLTAGFRLACLLLVPPRYWPSLFAGEIIAAGETAYVCSSARGVPWALAFLLVPITANMLSVSWFRKHRPVMDEHRNVSVTALFQCIAAAVVLSTSAEVLQYALMQGLQPALGWPAKASYFTYLWFLGTGLGIFMVVPLVLWMYSEGDMRNIRRRITRSPVLLASVAFLVPLLYLLGYVIGYSHSVQVRHVGQIIMLAAPVWFAVRYGWQGAGLACVLANLGIVLSMPSLYDPITLGTQTLMLLSSTVWLLLGARISVTRLDQALAH